MSPALAAAFRAARYLVAGLTLRPGARAVALARWMAGQRLREAWLITAENPMARRLPSAVNARRLARLRARLSRFRRWPAESRAPAGESWRERQILTDAPGAVVRRLARAFRQAAVLRLRRLGPPAVIATC